MKKIIFPIILLTILSISFVYSKNKASSKAPISFTRSEIPLEPIFPDTTKKTAPQILVKNDKNVSSPIKLSDINISVTIIGNIATTTMEMKFYNDSSQILEGEFYFPLGEGQTVSRFAMDVNGKLREGVIVEKEKGQQVFESTIRQQIDPGLLEWTQGNNFKARVYPLNPKGYKTIVVAYEEELKTIENSYYYLLPLNYKRPVDDFKLKIEVVNQAIEPTLYENELINFKFKKWEENFVAKFYKTNYLASKSLGISVPTPKNKQLIYTEKILGTNNQYYYYTTLSPSINKVKSELPKKVGLIWDASTSAINKNLQKEMTFFERYFNENKNVEVQLFILRNKLEKAEQFKIQGGNWNQLKEKLLSIPFDGASGYKEFNLSNYKADMYILSGDGLSNFGVKKSFISKTPIYIINSSISANHSLLKYISASSGGEYINLNTTKISDAVHILTSVNYQYFGNNQSNTFPSLPTTIQKDIHVIGIVTGEQDLTFNFGYKNPNEPIKLHIDPIKHLTNTGLLRRMWAQKKLNELDINFEENEDKITALGKEFGIVTRNTSLIVLDRIEDYVTHKIVPPKELQDEYWKIVEENTKIEEKEQQTHFDKVLNDFQVYIRWWEKDFDLKRIKEKDDKDVEFDRMSDSIGSGEGSGDGAGPPTPPSEEIEILESNMEYEETVLYSIAVSDGLASTTNTESSKKVKSKKNQRFSGISLAKWEPDAVYLKTLKKVSDDELYIKYLELKKEYKNTPSFFLDVSDLFIEKGKKELGLRILSNIAELELESHELLRVLAHRLEQLGYYKLAISVYNAVLKIRKEEPQSYRDLGLCLAKDKQYQKAIEMLYQVVEKPWGGRFPGIETLVLIEINQIIALHADKLDTAFIDSKYVKATPVDVRVILNWDADNCDMDLWVTDPRGEKCFYSHKETKIGGRISNDFTGGYGPEMFNIKNALVGKYKVQINYYGTSSQRVSGPTTIQVQLVTNYGKPNESTKEITRRLSTNKEILDIGELFFE